MSILNICDQELSESISDKITLINFYKAIISQVDYIVEKFIFENKLNEDEANRAREEIESARAKMIKLLEERLEQKLNPFDPEEHRSRYFYLFNLLDKKVGSVKLAICDMRLDEAAVKFYNQHE
jgi:hypothetical protein